MALYFECRIRLLFRRFCHWNTVCFFSRALKTVSRIRIACRQPTNFCRNSFLAKNWWRVLRLTLLRQIIYVLQNYGSDQQEIKLRALTNFITIFNKKNTQIGCLRASIHAAYDCGYVKNTINKKSHLPVFPSMANLSSSFPPWML